jgi:hypothetical protein
MTAAILVVVKGTGWLHAHPYLAESRIIRLARVVPFSRPYPLPQSLFDGVLRTEGKTLHPGGPPRMRVSARGWLGLRITPCGGRVEPNVCGSLRGAEFNLLVRGGGMVPPTRFASSWKRAATDRFTYRDTHVKRDHVCPMS